MRPHSQGNFRKSMKAAQDEGQPTSRVSPQQLKEYFVKCREYQSNLDSNNTTRGKSPWEKTGSRKFTNVGRRSGVRGAGNGMNNEMERRMTAKKVNRKKTEGRWSVVSMDPGDVEQNPESRRNSKRLSLTSSSILESTSKVATSAETRGSIISARIRRSLVIYPGAELIIFDVDTNGMMETADALEHYGFNVTVVAEYEKAKLCCKRERVEVLILALTAPNFHAIHLLRAMQPLKCVVIITVVDGAPDSFQDEINECVALGASSCMRKPLVVSQLVHRVSVLMTRKKNTEDVFLESFKYLDPDYAANKAKELIAAAEQSKQKSPLDLEEVRTLDEHGATVTKTKRKFLSAIQRTRKTFNAFNRAQNGQGSIRLTSIHKLARVAVSNNQTNKTRKSVVQEVKHRRVTAKFDESNTDPVTRIAFDPLRFASLPWELHDDAYVSKLGFNNNGAFQETQDILQCELREVIPTEMGTSSEHKFLLEGRKMRRAGNLRGAICMYNRAAYASRNCDFWPVFICRGVAFHLLGNDAQAMSDFTRCLELQPINPDALFNRALLRYIMGEDNGAVNDLNAGLRLAPEDEQMIYCRAYIFRRLTRFEDAKVDYQRRLVLLQDREKAAAEARINKQYSKEIGSRIDTGQNRKLKNTSMNMNRSSRDDEVFGFLVESESEDEEDVMRRHARRKQRRKRRKEQNSRRHSYVSTGEDKIESDSSASRSSDDEYSSDDDKFDNDDVDPVASLVDDTESVAGVSTKKEWDLNGDGRVDLEEFKTANNLGDNVYESLFHQKTILERALQRKAKGRTKQDVAEIAELLKTIFIFSAMPQHALTGLAKVVKFDVCPEGTLIIQEGAVGYNFFILLSGCVNVKVTVPGMDAQQTVNAMEAGDYFGETSMMGDNNLRKATVECANRCEVLYISSSAFQRFHVIDFINQAHAEKAQILRQASIFNDLTEEEFQSIAHVARYKTFDRNTVVLKQGDVPKYFVILVTGMVKVMQFSDTLADLERRQQEINEELNRFDMAYVYHHTSRPRVARSSHSTNNEIRHFSAGTTPGVDNCSNNNMNNNNSNSLNNHNNHNNNNNNNDININSSFNSSTNTVNTTAINNNHNNKYGKKKSALAGLSTVVAVKRKVSSMRARRSMGTNGPNMTTLTDAYIGEETTSAMRASERIGKKVELEIELKDVKKRLLLLRSKDRNVFGTKLVEIGTAYPPDFFGEMCLLDPLKGRERGSIISYTHLKVIVINKDQIGNIKKASSFLEGVRNKAFRYANHQEVKAKISHEQTWGEMRKKEMRQIDKKRWPVPSSAIKTMISGGGDTEILPEDRTPTVLSGLRVR